MNPVNSPDISNLTAEQKRELLAKLMQRKALKKTSSESTPSLKASPDQLAKQPSAEKSNNLSTESSQLNNPNTAPLSFAQQRLWFIDQLQPHQTVYTIPAALRLQGSLQVDILQRCLNEIVMRHEILRTQFIATEGEPVQSVLPQQSVELSITDLPGSELTAEDIVVQLRPYLTELVARPFNLASGPLLRAQLLQLSDNDHVLAVTVHHIIADYWSLKILIKEIALLYQAFSNHQPSPLRSLPIQYGDYAAWQHTQQANAAETQINYWLQQLAEPPTVLQLPTDRPRPAVQSFRGARHNFALSPELSQALSELAQRSQATLFMTLLAAFQVLLFRYSGQSDILVGSTVSNRDRAETKDLIGLFVNNLVFRSNVTAKQTFEQFLQQVKTTALSAYSHKDVPFEQVVDALKIERQLSHNALFQAMFILHNTPTSTFALPGLTVTVLEMDNSAARFDISLDMYESAAGLTGVFEYSTDLFAASTIARLAAHFETLLAALVAKPTSPIGSLPLLTSTESLELNSWNQTIVNIPEQCVHQIIEAQAKETPAAIAIGRSETYEQLNKRANQLAHYLKIQGATSGSRIALAINRSAELVIAMLAVLKIGGTYIPLDPTHPKARLQQVLQDSNATLVLESDSSITSLISALDCPILDLQKQAQEIDQQSTENISVELNPQDLAYIIYTSGSTGKPKGVPIRHYSLVNLLASMAKAPGIKSEDAFLAVTTVAFDIATLELLLPLTVGARLVIARPETIRDSDRLIAQLESDDITLMQATPATWRMLLDAGWKGSPTLKVLCGGEALDLPLAQQLLPCGRELWNLYGPTETTIWSAAIHIDESLLKEGFVPIGGPIDNTEFHILDEQQQAVPIGIPGELHIGGAGLSKGYLNRAELTAERFVTGLTPTTTLYKTGDLVRRRANGTLEYMGRLDHQIKLRGFRIELGEIEAVLNDHPDVDQSLVMLRANGNREPQLVAYCKIWSDIDPINKPPALRQNIGSLLPTYMLPTAYVFLTDFPLTPNGKIDRKALPEPKINPPKTQASAPQTRTEQLLAKIWEDTLNIAAVNTTDNFFELGGHSLLAARVIARLQPAFGIAVPLRSLFEGPTLSAFATTIDTALSKSTFTPIQPIDRENPIPLSYAQQRQWVLAQLEPDSPFYNIPAALRLVGDFSLPLLQESLALLCQRHEGLRSTFKSVEGEATLEILPTATPNIAYIDDRDSELSPQQIEDKLIAVAREPFDLEQSPLMRVQLIRTAEKTHIVLLVLHHIIADAGSVELLMREIVYTYHQLAESEPVALPPLGIQYADYAAWQQSLNTSEQLNYWKEQLANVPPLLSLPTDYPRPATQTLKGDSYRFTLTVEQTTALQQLSQRHSATVFMTLMAAFQSLLHRYSKAEDLVVGTPVANRPQASLENVLGMFVNTLVLRGDFSQELTFTELLRQVRATAIAAYTHQDVPFEQVIDALNVPRNWSYAPLFQVMFVWQAAKSDVIAPPGNLTWSPVPLDSSATKVDITLSMAAEKTEAGERLSGKFEYRQDLFKAGTIESMADAFCTLLDAITAAPDTLVSKLPLVSEQQRQQLQQWNGTAREYPTGLCLHQLFEQQVARSPQAPALVTSTETLSYQQLNAQANQLAHQLHTLGIRAESRVGICLDRTADLIVAILAVLKAGGAYVPLDPNYPADRLTYILEDADVSVVITQSAYREITATAPHTIVLDSDVLDSESTLPTAPSTVPTIAQPNNLAYIIYTSGSTGKPKGVAIEHRSPVALVQWANDVYSSAQLSGVLAATSVCFDLSIFEIFVPLSRGGSVILAKNVLQLPTLPAAEKVTLINTVPTAIAELARINGIPSSVSTINLAGEPIPSSLVQQLYGIASIQQVFNLYGPSEDTTYSTYTLLSPKDAIVPIGKPIANTQAYVLDEQQNSVSIGMTGELYLAGQGVAREYWNQTALTAARFVTCELDRRAQNRSKTYPTKSTLYKTGDLVRYRPDGQLEFLGRIDSQVKIRGFRIELGEIESVVLKHSQIIQTAVIDWSDAQNNRQLVAYVVLDELADKEAFGQALQTTSELFRELRSHLKTSLPDYMLPAIFVPLGSLPLLPNGKISRRALPAPIFKEALKVKESVLTTTEQALVNVWQGLLNQPVGIHDNFFELGGDSILAIQAIAQAQKVGLYFSPRDLFQYATISQLAGIATTQPHSQAQQSSIVGAVPLTPIQHWFFQQTLEAPHHWNQSILLTVKQPLRSDILEQALRQLMHHHDALRATFQKTGQETEQGWQQIYGAPSDKVPLKVVQGRVENATHVITAEAEAIQSSFELESGPLLKVVYYDLETSAGAERRLLIVCHHLIIDGVSWRILLSDLQFLYQQLSQSVNQSDSPPDNLQLPPKTLSFQVWSQQLSATDFTAELPYWESVATADLPPFPQDFTNGDNTMGTADTFSVSLTPSETEKLLKGVPQAYSARIDDILLTALILALSPPLEQPFKNHPNHSLRLSLEGHGRSDDQDLSRTVGWLTTLYPVLLTIPSTTDLGAAIKAVKETLRAIPQQGLGYGVLRYLKSAEHPSEQQTGESSGKTLDTDTPIRFNYLGQTDQLFSDNGWLAPATESAGAARSPEDPRDVLLEINAVVSRGRLTLHWTYSQALHKKETISDWAAAYLRQLRALIEHCLSTDTDSGYSPADFPQMELEQGDLDDLLASLGGEA